LRPRDVEAAATPIVDGLTVDGLAVHDLAREEIDLK
jgi:hypothetical protein